MPRELGEEGGIATGVGTGGRGCYRAAGTGGRGSHCPGDAMAGTTKPVWERTRQSSPGKSCSTNRPFSPALTCAYKSKRQRLPFLHTARQECAEPSRGRHPRSLGRTEPESRSAFSTAPQRLPPGAQDSPAEPLLGSQRRWQHAPARAALIQTTDSCSWSSAATCRHPGSWQRPATAQCFLCPAQDGGWGDGG